MKIKSPEYVLSAYRYEQCPNIQQPEIAFAGRSNVGKSSLINRLLNKKKLARTSAKPGRTQSLNYYNLDDKFYFVDLPGYGFAHVPTKVRDDWAELIDTYLNQRPNLAGVLSIIDARHKPSSDDKMMIEWLRASGLPYLIVATKADKLSNNQQVKQKKVISNELRIRSDEKLIFFSAETSAGKMQVWEEIGYMLQYFND